MDEGRWDMARVALGRARAGIIPPSPDEDEAAFTALRLALGSVDLRGALEELESLVGRMAGTDPTWNARVRRLIADAPPALVDEVEPAGDASSPAG